MMCVTEQVIVFVIKQRHNVYCHLSVHFFAWTGVDSLLNFIIGLSSQWFFPIFLPFPSLLVWNLKGHRIIQCDSVSTFHPLFCLLVLSLKLQFNLHLSTQCYQIMQRILVMLFFLQELDFEPSVSLLSSIAESFQLVCLALVLGWVQLSQGMVDPAVRLSDPLAAFWSSFSLWPGVCSSHSSSGTAEGHRAVAQQTFQTGWPGDGGFGGSLVWFSFHSQSFLPENLSLYGEPLFCKGMRSVKWKQSLLLALCFGLLQQSRFHCVVVGFVFWFLVLALFKETGHQCLQWQPRILFLKEECCSMLGKRGWNTTIESQA